MPERIFCSVSPMHCWDWWVGALVLHLPSSSAVWKAEGDRHLLQYKTESAVT